VPDFPQIDETTPPSPYFKQFNRYHSTSLASQTLLPNFTIKKTKIKT